MEISKEFRFEAAHRLPMMPEGHKCQRLHGHSYRVRVYVRGPVRGDGTVMDFGDLAYALEPIRLKLDHYCLNDIPGLENPTSENLARWIWSRVVLPDAAVELTCVEVRETCTSAAFFRGVR